ncbi:ATP-binding cassette domain-containing protein [Nonomuraea sp. NPDC050451]|uniref:ATP-binding cassette domain-containing protein n=1 Tax=Nonomuraea sp. NPDC050451 TaxID=3364364 RepID=UPI0037A3D9B4
MKIRRWWRPCRPASGHLTFVTWGRLTSGTTAAPPVEQGQTVALLGPNGAGRTTMLSIALGLLSPDEGTAGVFGRPPTEALRQGHVGAPLQDAGLPDDVRVAELVGAEAGGLLEVGSLASGGYRLYARVPLGEVS